MGGGGDHRVAALVRMAEADLDDEKLQRIFCLAVGNLATQNNGYKNQMGSHGGLLHTLKAMERHARDESIQEAASTALTSMAYDHINNSRAMYDYGVTELLVAAMDRFPHSAGIQQCS